MQTRAQHPAHAADIELWSLEDAEAWKEAELCDDFETWMDEDCLLDNDLWMDAEAGSGISPESLNRLGIRAS